MLAELNIKSKENLQLPSTFQGCFGTKKPGFKQYRVWMLKVYIVQTGRSIQIRIKEGSSRIWLAKADKSEVAENNINQEHTIKLQITKTTFC